MTPRERLEKSLSFEEPDRVPIDLGGLISTIEVKSYQNLLNYFNIQDKIRVFSRLHTEISEEILGKFKVDTRYIRFGKITEWVPKQGGDDSQIDEWGVTWTKPEGCEYYDPVGYPLEEAKLEDLANYPWPDKIMSEDIDRWRKRAEHLCYETDYAVIGDATGIGIFEQSQWLRGLSKFLKDLYRDRDFAEALLIKVLETQKKRFASYLEAIGGCVQVIIVTDDLGQQHGPLISPQLYRELIKPLHRELYSFIKSRTDAKLLHHSCGAITEFLDDLIDVGVDIINPVQVGAKGMNDTALLKSKFGGKIVFWGAGCDAQKILPYGNPNEIKKEVRRRIKDLAPQGGYVFSPIHNIQPGVPPENIAALFETAVEYGKYPI